MAKGVRLRRTPCVPLPLRDAPSPLRASRSPHSRPCWSPLRVMTLSRHAGLGDGCTASEENFRDVPKGPGEHRHGTAVEGVHRVRSHGRPGSGGAARPAISPGRKGDRCCNVRKVKLAFSTLGVPGLPVPTWSGSRRTTATTAWSCARSPEEPVHPGIDRAERADVAAEFGRRGSRFSVLAGYAGGRAGRGRPRAATRSATRRPRPRPGRLLRAGLPRRRSRTTGERGRRPAARRLAAAAARVAADLGRAGPAGDPRLAPHAVRTWRGCSGLVGHVTSARCGTSCTPGWAASSRRRPIAALAPLPGLRAGQGHRLGRGHHAAAARRRGHCRWPRPWRCSAGRLGRLAVLGVREAVVPGRPRALPELLPGAWHLVRLLSESA